MEDKRSVEPLSRSELPGKLGESSQESSGILPPGNIFNAPRLSEKFDEKKEGKEGEHD